MKRKLAVLLLIVTIAACASACSGSPASGSSESSQETSAKILELKDKTLKNVSYKVPAEWTETSQSNGSILYAIAGTNDGFYVSYDPIDTSKTTVDKTIQKTIKNMKSNAEFLTSTRTVAGVEATKLRFKVSNSTYHETSLSSIYHDAYLVPVGENAIFVIDFTSSTSESKYSDTFDAVLKSITINASSETSSSDVSEAVSDTSASEQTGK